MAASAPVALACWVSSMASAVEFEPQPAITGTPVPFAVCTQISMTRLCSSKVSVGDSPVVPHGTRPSVPSAICQVTNFSNPFSSTDPFLNGVINATSDPVNMGSLQFPCFSNLIPTPRHRKVSNLPPALPPNLALVKPQRAAYDSWYDAPSPPPPAVCPPPC